MATMARNPGDLAVAFIQNLTLVGDFAGRKFVLRDWQKDIVRKTFGTLAADGRRQYRKVFIALPRKQAKTTLIAAKAGFSLVGECRGKQGQQIYSASGDRAQASLIFNTLASMIRADTHLSRLVTIHDSYKRMRFEPLGNTFEALSSEAGTKHGLSPSHVLFDEVHVLPNRELHDVLTTGFGARAEPLTEYITTAGWDRHSICWEVWDYARKVRDKVVDDPRFLPILYEAGPEEPWDDEAVWHRVMPALGDFCSLEFIREECAKARNIPAYENTFRQLYLNQWTEQATRWIQAERWAACGTLDPADFDGRDCYYDGLDLGVTGDMAGYAKVSPNDLGGFDVAMKYWVPREGRWRNEPRNKDLYLQWERSGHLTFTEGEALDTDQVERDIVGWNGRQPARMLFADRAYAMGLLSRLFNTHDVPVKGIPQGPVTLNEPMVALESMILRGTLRHDGNPVLAWNVANATARRNSSGLLHLDKSGAGNRIDGLAALINAVAAATAGGDETGYHTSGIFIL